jgi:hypothetical protein
MTAFALRIAITGAGDQPAGEPAEETRCRDQRAIACAACLATITAIEHRLAVHGSHEHRFVNPAGLLFHIGCFAEAIGCRIAGPDSLEYPWFPGFAWRYASCAGCGQHLGWHFRDDARSSKSVEMKPSFFGLILDRLVQPGFDS